MRRFILLATLLVASVAFSQGSPPGQDQKNGGQSNERNQTKKNAVVAPFATAGTQTTPPGNGTEREQSKTISSKENKPGFDWSLFWSALSSIATLAVMVITIFQAILTRRSLELTQKAIKGATESSTDSFAITAWQLHVSEELAKATTKSADAATKSAQTAELTLHVGQRAYLAVTQELSLEDNWIKGKLTVRNVGPTLAREICFGSLHHIGTEGLPAFSEDPLDGDALEDFILFPGEPREVPISIELEDGKQRVAILNGNTVLCFYGRFRYEDVFGIVRETGFGYRYDPLANLCERPPFRQTTAKGYNFIR